MTTEMLTIITGLIIMSPVFAYSLKKHFTDTNWDESSNRERRR